MGMHPNKSKTLICHNTKKVGGARARKHRHSLALTGDKLRTILADETHPLRLDFHTHTHTHKHTHTHTHTQSCGHIILT